MSSATSRPFCSGFNVLINCCSGGINKCTIFRATWWRHQMETFPRFWAFVQGIHRSPVNSPHKGQWHGALMFSLICAGTNGWVNHRDAGDMRRHLAHYDVIVMSLLCFWQTEYETGLYAQYYVITTYQRRFEVIMALLLRRASAGTKLFPNWYTKCIFPPHKRCRYMVESVHGINISQCL